MKRLFVVMLILFAANAIYAQNFEMRNSIIVESNLIMTLSASYDRIMPIKEKLAVTVGGDYIMGVGFGYGAHWIEPEANLLLFGPRHFLEAGIIYAFNLISGDEEADSNSSPGFRFAYKIQGKKGFTLRASANFLFDIDPVFVPEVGVGYSF